MFRPLPHAERCTPPLSLLLALVLEMLLPKIVDIDYGPQRRTKKSNQPFRTRLSKRLHMCVCVCVSIHLPAVHVRMQTSKYMPYMLRTVYDTDIQTRVLV